MKSFLTTIALIIFFAFQSAARNVMTWIPVYGISDCKALLNDATKSEWIKNGVTHIGLQFWVPGDNGAAVFVTDYQFKYKAATISQDVQDFVAWGKANNIKVMMCFHNIRSNDFDWTYTQQVINTYPNQTVASIKQIVDFYGLDGVDIDFEGTGNYASDKPAFVNFLDTLGSALHQSGKQLSVDMFSTPCYNAPNPSWESAMAPHVDFMNIMGYSDTYEADETLFGYCPQTPSEKDVYAFRYSYIENYLTAKQGVASSKLCYGLPAWVDEWGGQCLQAHILDITDISAAGGLAIWDLQLSAGGFWTDPRSWDLIRMFRQDSTSASIHAHIKACEKVTAISDVLEKKGHIYYDADHQVMNLAGMPGDLYLYSASGVLEKNWHIQAGENVSLVNMRSSFYIAKFQTSSDIYTEKVNLLR